MTSPHTPRRTCQPSRIFDHLRSFKDTTRTQCSLFVLLRKSGSCCGSDVALYAVSHQFTVSLVLFLHIVERPKSEQNNKKYGGDRPHVTSSTWIYEQGVKHGKHFVLLWNFPVRKLTTCSARAINTCPEQIMATQENGLPKWGKYGSIWAIIARLFWTAACHRN